MVLRQKCHVLQVRSTAGTNHNLSYMSVRYTALFTLLVWWYAGAVSLPLGDVILAQLPSPLNFLFTSVACIYKTIMIIIMMIVSDATIWSVTPQL
jgi:hypothetical protein